MPYFVRLTTCNAQGENETKELINLDKVLRVAEAESATTEPTEFNGCKLWFSKTDFVIVAECKEWIEKLLNID